ncbi:hypothetical protein [Pedobacter nutrimenti]|uniref:hypothetical protein n=1 Tax=Pedobacter nutrimenti TaxID=1241337 RepID=UPI002930C441|nr:hypothetical protein [Pedobacter nutrimenti]
MHTKKEVRQSLTYHLTAEEISNPYLLIAQFFDISDLSDHLEFLDKWKEHVLTDQVYTAENCPANLLHEHRHILKLLEAAWLLRKAGKVSPLIFPEVKELLLERQKGELSGCFCQLNEEELLNPYLIFRSLFQSTGLEAYREELRDWLEESFSKEGPSFNYQDLAVTYKFLQKLFQAAWLIYNRELQMNLSQ